MDPGEEVSATLKREFGEEALGGKTIDMGKVWKNGKRLYAGYVDDPRNTDNAWMETVVVSFHDYESVMDDVKLEVFLINICPNKTREIQIPVFDS